MTVLCVITLVVSLIIVCIDGRHGSTAGAWIVSRFNIVVGIEQPMHHRYTVVINAADELRICQGFTDTRCIQQWKELLAENPPLRIARMTIHEAVEGTGWWGLTRMRRILRVQWDVFTDPPMTGKQVELTKAERDEVRRLIIEIEVDGDLELRRAEASGRGQESVDVRHEATFARYVEESVQARIRWLGFLQNLVTIAAIAWLPSAFRSLRRAGRTERYWRMRRRYLPKGVCPSCRYDLRGGRHARCPECGYAIRPAEFKSTRANS